MGKKPYDETNAEDIERYAKQLDGHSLRQVVGDVPASQRRGGKGTFGHLVEEHYFRYTANSRKGPDFPEAGVELKTSPLYRLKRGGKLRSKERLVLNIINYEEVAKEADFGESSFWYKNKLLLLMFYIWAEDQDALDYLVHLSRLWVFPEADLKIIRDDWQKIVTKVRQKQAHELSEKDTLYLAACRKGPAGPQLRVQTGGPPAKQRAFSLKPSYLNTIISRSAPGNLEPALKDPNALAPGETFEGYVVRIMSRYSGRTEESLKREFGLDYEQTAKHRAYMLAKAMLGVHAKKVAEFEKANVAVRTIRLEEDGRIKEHIPFRYIKYKKIIDEEWDESQFYGELNRRFLFVMFRRTADDELIFERCMFWSIPAEALEQAHLVWEDTRAKVIRGDYNHFLGASDNSISHVRPHANDSRDLTDTPQGGRVKKYGFWLDKYYMREQLEVTRR